MVEVNLKRTFSSGEWEKGAAIKDNVIIVEKWAFGQCPSKYKVATKTDKKDLIIYFIFTNMLFLLIVLLILI